MQNYLVLLHELKGWCFKDTEKTCCRLRARLHGEHSFLKGFGLSVREDILNGDGKHMTLEYMISDYGHMALVIGTYLGEMSS